MKCSTLWSLRFLVCRLLPFSSLLLSASLIVRVLAIQRSGAVEAAPAVTTAAPISEEATPDCDYPPADPFPLRQRARHLASLGVDRWHAAGVKGGGVKIAVLDSGFRGYKTHLGKALPKKVTVRSFRADGNLEAKDSQHGILCSEVIHALAPDAELMFANWDPNHPEEFLAAARWARAQGARIISCSVIMPSWSDGEGGGAVHAAMAKILGAGRHAGDVLCFASAGNTAQRHWSGAFRDNGAGFHLWRDGATHNRLYPWSNERVSVELCAPPGAGYQVIVTDSNGQTVGRTVTHCGGDRSCVVVQLTPADAQEYRVQVRRGQGKASPFHVVALGAGLTYSTSPGSVAFPADGPEVLAVGAVGPNGNRAGYSSCGPNSHKPKPDFVAPVPFPSLWRSRPFTGTSAAAPQAAGLAALCWARHPDWTAEQINNALRSSARDLGDEGHDWETGYGMIAMPREW